MSNLFDSLRGRQKDAERNARIAYNDLVAKVAADAEDIPTPANVEKLLQSVGRDLKAFEADVNFARGRRRQQDELRGYDDAVQARKDAAEDLAEFEQTREETIEQLNEQWRLRKGASEAAKNEVDRLGNIRRSLTNTSGLVEPREEAKERLQDAKTRLREAQRETPSLESAVASAEAKLEENPKNSIVRDRLEFAQRALDSNRKNVPILEAEVDRLEIMIEEFSEQIVWGAIPPLEV